MRESNGGGAERELTGYRRLSRSARATLARKGSKFIATARLVESEDEARAVLSELNVEFPGASHHPYAYRVGRKTPRVRYSDDGEPAGTAGPPLLNQLQGRKLTDSILVVSRIFGGTLLGTGGLVKAYGDAGRAAVEGAGVQRMVPHVRFRLDIPYKAWGRIEHGVLNRDCTIAEVDYLELVRVTVDVPCEEVEKFRMWIGEITSGTVDLKKVDALHRPQNGTGVE